MSVGPTQRIAPARRIFQPVRGRGLRKLLWKRLHLPRSWVHGALWAAKAAANPRQLRERRRIARALAPGSQAVGRVDSASGYLLHGSGSAAGPLPGSQDVVAYCERVFRELRAGASVEKHGFNPNKPFLLALLAGADFLAHPELLRFMVSRPILDVATDHLGAVPLLAGAAFWWTPENATARRSQLYHFDAEDERQLKLFVNVRETTSEHGPLTFLRADVSAPLRSPASLRGRVPDAAVAGALGSTEPVVLVGPPGSGAFVDTSRCLHFGSRGNRRERLVLMAQYLRFDCPTESTFDFRVPPGLLGPDLDAVQKLALGLR